ncbi:MAG: hypothetical protein IJS61_06365 [Firmicutes bacterium]|nr:hypothetical protein [Bacillota bacterium]
MAEYSVQDEILRKWKERCAQEEAAKKGALSSIDMTEYLDIALELETSLYTQKALLRELYDIFISRVLTYKGILKEKYPMLEHYTFKDELFNRDEQGFCDIKNKDRILRLKYYFADDVKDARSFQANYDAKPQRYDNYYLYYSDKLYGLIPYFAIVVVFGSLPDDDFLPVFNFTLKKSDFPTKADADFEAHKILLKLKNVLNSMASIVEKYAEDLLQKWKESPTVDFATVIKYFEKKEHNIKLSDELSSTIQRRIKNLKTTEEILKKFYNVNIIFPKYRNIVAIASFNEYWKTGRVNELSGPNGAYNLYESETRMNQVINRLDVIIRDLEQIKQNQYTLYNAIKDANRLLSGFTQELSKIRTGITLIDNKLESANLRLAMISTNTNIITKNTKAIKYMNLYDTLFK